MRPSKTTATPDHNVPTWNQDKPISDPISKYQVETLTKNCDEFGITLYGLGNKKNGMTVTHLLTELLEPSLLVSAPVR